jgi:hypothetical protein
MSRKPPVGNARWDLQYENTVDQYNRMTYQPQGQKNFQVYFDTNRENSPYGCFYKVVITGSRPKYFYGETAYTDVARYVNDMGDPNGWGCLS